MQSSSAGWQKASRTSELEVIQGIAALSASGQFGNAKVCAGIIATTSVTAEGGEADHTSTESTTASERLRELVASGRNFRGIRLLGGKAEQIPFDAPYFNALMAAMEDMEPVKVHPGPPT